MSREKKKVSAPELMAQLRRDPPNQAPEEAQQVRIAIDRKAAAPIGKEIAAASSRTILQALAPVYP